MRHGDDEDDDVLSVSRVAYRLQKVKPATTAQAISTTEKDVNVSAIISLFNTIDQSMSRESSVQRESPTN